MKKLSLRAMGPIYLIGAVLTFGHECVRLERDASFKANPAFTSLIIAAIWPTYWPLRGSYLAFGGGAQ